MGKKCSLKLITQKSNPQSIRRGPGKPKKLKKKEPDEDTTRIPIHTTAEYVVKMGTIS